VNHSERINQITKIVLDAAIRVHTVLGPGLLESVDEECLARELVKRGLTIERQKHIPLVWDGEPITGGFRLDLLVEGLVVVEIKAVEALVDVHRAQVLTYLKLTGLQVGLLFNFNTVRLLRGGTRRIVYGFVDPP
jgi:GxxExxY protein